MSGNKGAVAIRLDYRDTSFCFLTAHLAAGHSNVEERNADYHTIAGPDGLHFSKGKTIASHEYVSLSLSRAMRMLTKPAAMLFGLPTRIIESRCRTRTFVAWSRRTISGLSSQLIKSVDSSRIVVRVLTRDAAFDGDENETCFRRIHRRTAALPTYLQVHHIATSCGTPADERRRYDNGTEIYDSSEKNRAPAWTGAYCQSRHLAMY